MKIKLWGVRGSLPTPQNPEEIEKKIKELFSLFFKEGYRKKEDIKTFLKSLTPAQKGGFGGNTPCVEVRAGSQSIIIDGGSGIKRLSESWMQGPLKSGKGEVHILFTHFHWDHLIGLPFFHPFYLPGMKIHLYAVQPELEAAFKTMFTKPYFPVPFESLRSNISFHKLEPRKKFRIASVDITPYQLDHPDPCWGYRFEHGGRVYIHAVDTECNRVSRKQLGPDLPFYQGVDLMVFDAQYNLQESLNHLSWGHASATFGLDLAMREGIKRILFIHHDPASSDKKIASMSAQTKKYYQQQMTNAKKSGEFLHEVEWEFAQEGLVYEV